MSRHTSARTRKLAVQLYLEAAYRRDLARLLRQLGYPAKGRFRVAVESVSTRRGRQVASIFYRSPRLCKRFELDNWGAAQSRLAAWLAVLDTLRSATTNPPEVTHHAE